MKRTENLFLDDIRNPLDAYSYMPNPIYLKEDWSIVRNYSEFVAFILTNGLPKQISFDHDLADIHYTICNDGMINYENMIEKTGYHCAMWLVNYCMDKGNVELPIYHIHSMNNVGGQNIRKLLENYEKHCKKTV